MASDPSPVDQWTWVAMSPELSELEMKLRNEFVDQLLIDGDYYKAALRVGFQAAFAKDYAEKFRNCSYVQRRIQEVRQVRKDERRVDEYDKNIVRDVLRRVAQDETAPHSARVQAVTKMAAIIGMDKPDAKDKDNFHKGGVLMVPAIANLDDWEAAAQASQAKLVADART